MPWGHYLPFFVGGLFLANGIPHFVNGVMGRPFQTPFAKPPGRGLSSSTVNTLWGSTNFAVSYIIVHQARFFDWHSASEAIAFGLGLLFAAVLLAFWFGRINGGNSPGCA